MVDPQIEVHKINNTSEAKYYNTSQWSCKYTQVLAFSVLLLAQWLGVLVKCGMVVHTPLGLSAGLAGSQYRKALLLLLQLAF